MEARPLWPNFSELGRELLDWLWPRQCELCQVMITSPEGRLICAGCRRVLANDPWNCCPRCSSTIGPHTDTSSGCPNCRDERYAFSAAFRLGPYEGQLREAVLRAKGRTGELLAEELGELLGQKLQNHLSPKPELIVPIPLHWRRRWERGHNQSLAIARGLARLIPGPLESALIRTKNTPHQTSVSAAQRRDNLRGAFELKKKTLVRNKRILLVDDVLTTGSTAHAAAQVLNNAGAAQVTLVVLAHR